MNALRWWKGTALLLATLAAAACLNALLSAPRKREILARRTADLTVLAPYENRWAAEEAFLNQLEARHAFTPAALEPLAARLLGPSATLNPRPAAPVGRAGWQTREVVLELADGSYDALALFLSAAAETPPAWRLKEIALRPSGGAGRGAATLTLEALEKRTP